MRGTCPGHISCQATLVSFLSVFVLFSFNFVKPACYWDPLPLRALSKLESKVCGWFGTRQTQGSRPIISLTSLNWAQMPWESCFSRWKLGKLFQELHPGACWLALGLYSRSPPHHYLEGLSIRRLLGIALMSRLVSGFSPRAREAAQAFKTHY